ncbi:hypothetical protein BDV24DRAFT_170282 [Aspergillus arachidicola]|uniref:Heat-labile enterotoxin IIA, A chain n=1 Tax=Aspergillus arachidicola TaxID=656916 RepID=A0A5N6XQD2_9EURO|nr:hypothetical protein BDV24DRAFT_170282 [Aspergillus arachidicola]
MKTATLYLSVFIGLAIATPLGRRAPQAPTIYKETSPGMQIIDAAKGGIKDWGPTGSLRAPERGPSGPTRNMPFNLGMPELQQHGKLRKENDEGLPGTPGNPLGPQKKPDRIYERPKVTYNEPNMATSGTAPSGKLGASRGFRVNGPAGTMVAFEVLAPYARDVLEELKEWDNPIGRSVRWFDDAITSTQEAIGGKQVPEIHGNELKLKLICWLRGEQQYPNEVDRACRRQRKDTKGQTEQEKEQERVKGLNQVFEACDQVETEPPADGNLRADLLKRCKALRDKSLEIEDKAYMPKTGVQVLSDRPDAEPQDGTTLDPSLLYSPTHFIGALKPIHKS